MLRSSFQNAFMWPWQSLLTRKVLNYIGVPLSIEQEKKEGAEKDYAFPLLLLKTHHTNSTCLPENFLLPPNDWKKHFPLRRTYFLLSSIFLSEINKRLGWNCLIHHPFPLYNSFFTSHRCWSQDRSPVNFLNVNLQLRVFFLGNTIKEGWIQK